MGLMPIESNWVRTFRMSLIASNEDQDEITFLYRQVEIFLI